MSPDLVPSLYTGICKKANFADFKIPDRQENKTVYKQVLQGGFLYFHSPSFVKNENVNSLYSQTPAWFSILFYFNYCNNVVICKWGEKVTFKIFKTRVWCCGTEYMVAAYNASIPMSSSPRCSSFDSASY